jgi:hypothetical protein
MYDQIGRSRSVTYIILSNDQMVKIAPRANRDYVRRVLESELTIGANRSPGPARPQPQRRGLLRWAAGWVLGVERST